MQRTPGRGSLSFPVRRGRLLAFPIRECYTDACRGGNVMDWVRLFGWITSNPMLSAGIGLFLLCSLAAILYAFFRILPHQTFPILFLNLIIHFSTYLIAKVLPIPYVFHDITSFLDTRTPFLPSMILVYLLAYEEMPK